MMNSYQRMSSNRLKSSLARAMLINALLNIALSSIMVRAQRAMTVRPILKSAGDIYISRNGGGDAMATDGDSAAD
jgi:hypothetical protein